MTSPDRPVIDTIADLRAECERTPDPGSFVPVTARLLREITKPPRAYLFQASTPLFPDLSDTMHMTEVGTWKHQDIKIGVGGMPATPDFVKRLFDTAEEVAKDAGWKAALVSSQRYAEDTPDRVQFYCLFEKESP